MTVSTSRAARQQRIVEILASNPVRSQTELLDHLDRALVALVAALVGLVLLVGVSAGADTGTTIVLGALTAVGSALGYAVVTLAGGGVPAGIPVTLVGFAGGALLPMLYGALSDHAGAQAGYWLLLPCYAWILFYAWRGHALRAWR